MDAFYASVEQLDHPEYLHKPVIVGADPKQGRGRGVVSACSYEARKFGVRSALPISKAWKLCPQGIYVLPRMHRYAEVSRQVMDILARFTDLIEPLSIDEAFLDVTGSVALWGEAAEIAHLIKKQIREEVRLNASIGVGPNKFLAKIASDLRKPDALVVVPADVGAFLHPLPVGRLWGVGPKTEVRLKALKLFTIGDVAACSRELLVSKLGSLGNHIHHLSHGEDDRPVVANAEPKSISNETTFDEDVDDREVIIRTITGLADQVAARLRAHGYRAGRVTLKLRVSDFTTYTRQLTVEQPIQTGNEIARIALELFRKLVIDQKVRLLGVGAGDLNHKESQPGQLSLFSPSDRLETLAKTTDEIEARFGKGSIRRGSRLT